MAQPSEVAELPSSKTRPTRKEKENVVPLIEVKLIKNVFSAEQKREIIERLTETMVEIEGENMRPVTWVTVEEVQSGDWGIGGNALTTENVKALQAGVAAYFEAGGGGVTSAADVFTASYDPARDGGGTDEV
jgi:4-oxalocrotonate tautomerase